MSLTSWFRAPQSNRSPALNKPSGRKSPRQPIYARPRLESLEERMMLDAAASNGVQPGANNPTFNSAQASNGVVLPSEHISFAQTTGLTNQIYPNAAGGAALAAVAAPLAADQSVSQFRSFGVNSQGTDIREDLNYQLGIMMANVYGFGSGTAPNAPWMPNAYNLGLANHQSGYPSQTDMGFSSVAPWFRVSQAPQKEQDPSLNLDLKEEEQEAVKPDEVLAKRSLREEEQPRPTWIDDITKHKAEEERMQLEQQTAQKQPSLDRIMDAEGNLPDSLWLSALAPAPMASLVAGLPGLAAAEESGDGAAECGDGGGEAGE